MLKGVYASDKIFGISHGKFIFSADFLNERLWHDSQIVVLVYEKFELIAQIPVLFVVRRCGKEQDFAALIADKLLDVLVAFSARIAQIVAFVNDDKAVETHIFYIKGL